MSDIKLSTLTNDLEVTNGDLDIILMDGAIRQSLLQRLRLFLGEWFLDTSHGVPYFQSILVKNPNLDLIQATIKNVVLSTPGITELLTFEFDYNNATRVLSVSFDARSTNGTVIQVTDALGGGI